MALALEFVTGLGLALRPRCCLLHSRSCSLLAGKRTTQWVTFIFFSSRPIWSTSALFHIVIFLFVNSQLKSLEKIWNQNLTQRLQTQRQERGRLCPKRFHHRQKEPKRNHAGKLLSLIPCFSVQLISGHPGSFLFLGLVAFSLWPESAAGLESSTKSFSSNSRCYQTFV